MALEAQFKFSDFTIKTIELSSGRYLRLGVYPRIINVNPTGDVITFTDRDAGFYIDKHAVEYKTGDYQINMKVQLAFGVGTLGLSPDDPIYSKCVPLATTTGVPFLTDDELAFMFKYYYKMTGDFVYSETVNVDLGFQDFGGGSGIPAFDGFIPGEGFPPFAGGSYNLAYIWGESTAYFKRLAFSSHYYSDERIKFNFYNTVTKDTRSTYAAPPIRRPFIELTNWGSSGDLCVINWFVDVEQITGG